MPFDNEMRLPRHLVNRAFDEMREDGVICVDTAAHLIEHGADMHRLEKQIAEQVDLMELA